MELREAYIKSVYEVFQLYGVKTQFVEEVTEEFETAVDQINILIGFSDQVKGEIVFSFNKSQTLRIVGNILNLDVKTIDQKVINLMTEIITLITSVTFGKFQASMLHYLPPVFIRGENVMLLNNQRQVQKLIFKVDDDFLKVSYMKLSWE